MAFAKEHSQVVSMHFGRVVVGVGCREGQNTAMWVAIQL